MYNLRCDIDTWVIDNYCINVIFRSNMPVRSYDPEKNLGCVHCDLEFGEMTLGQRLATPFCHEINCVKDYPDGATPTSIFYL